MLTLGVMLTLFVYGIVRVMEQGQPLHPQAAAITAPWIPSTVKHWQTPIVAMSKKYDVDPNLLAIIMTLESGGYAKANSGEAQGLMQITPGTGKDIASKFLKQPRTTYDLYDPKTNIEFGAAYLSYLRDEFGAVNQGPSWDTTVELVAAGYNGGPGGANDVEQGRGLEDIQTVVYSRDAFNMWRERHASKSPTLERWLARGGSDLVTAAKDHHQ